MDWQQELSAWEKEMKHKDAELSAAPPSTQVLQCDYELFRL
jgi:hypothetical protein